MKSRTQKKYASSQKKLASLLYASPETDGDMLYFGRFFAPDAFLAFEIEGKRIAVLNALEWNRAQRESRFDRVFLLEEFASEIKKLAPQGDALHSIAGTIKCISDLYKTYQYRVPFNFPAGLLKLLSELGIDIQIEQDPFFPERAIKTPEEIECIRTANQMSAFGIRAAEETLTAASIQDGWIYFEGALLTSEKLQRIIEKACLDSGGRSSHTIAAGGDQACDPHCTGHGPLRADQFIIVDVFPRANKTGYYGDMTRTFLKGKASAEQRKLIQTVQAAQKSAIQKIKSGVFAKTLYEATVTFFEASGYMTGCTDGIYRGFFHGLGHGLGLDIHESPRLKTNTTELQENMVITVEPGLYYPGLGGVRIEDVICVQKSGYTLLSDYHYEWEIT